MRQLLAGEPVTAGGDTIAEGIAVRDIGALPLAICARWSTRSWRSARSTIEQAIAAAARDREDGGGGRGCRRPRRRCWPIPQRFAGRKVGLVLSGGNIDTRLLASVLMRGLVRDGRHRAPARCMISDLPGQLAKVAGLIGKAGGNIVEVQHQRLFGGVVAKAAELDVTVETRGRDHARELVAALQAAGFTVRVLEGVEA